jgi:hypothetical protein
VYDVLVPNGEPVHARTVVDKLIRAERAPRRQGRRERFQGRALGGINLTPLSSRLVMTSTSFSARSGKLVPTVPFGAKADFVGLAQG